MEYRFTEEQDQFREIVARFMVDKSPTMSVRKLMIDETGSDPGVWRQLCEELGLAGIHIPEKYGGAGFGSVELGVVMEEQGRALLCAPYLASAVMGGYAILLAGSEDQKQRFLPQIADGSLIATLAVSEANGLWTDADIQMEATGDQNGFTLTGKKRFVVDGDKADVFIVVARHGAGRAFFVVNGGSAGMKKARVTAMDPTRKIADIEFKDVPADLLGEGGADQMEAYYNAVLIAFSNEMIGGAQAMLASTIDYANLRVQFGRSIGSFQAIKHRCADTCQKVELARATVYQAAQVFSDGEDATAAASMAKACASEAYLHAAKECIQFHGGIGFTWENDTHLWFKRAKSSEVFLGTPQQHRERMLQAMGI